MNAFIAIASTIIVSILLSRFLVMRKVTRKMMMKSSETEREEANKKLPQEVRAKVMPGFKTLTVDYEFDEAVDYRRSLNEKAIKQFKLAFKYDMMAALGYLLLSLGDGIFIALPYAFLSTMRFLAFRDQFRAHHKGIAGFLGPLKNLFLEIAKPKWSFYIALLAILVAIMHAIFPLIWGYFEWTNIGLLGASLLHILLLANLRKSLSEKPNLKLLVLRVFGINEAALFTFEGLLTYWKFFGSFFTVVDPSFLKSVVKRRNQIIPLLMVSFLVLVILEVRLVESGLDAKKINYLVVLPSVALCGFFYIKHSVSQVDKRFIKNKSHLKNELRQLGKWPRALNHEFKSLPTMCYDNTWKMAVSEFVYISDVILMDLRGFSEERKGCEYEVDFLFDNANVDKVVFLISHNGLELAKKLILDRWKFLREDSPNLFLESPIIKIYVSSRENNKDIQGILDLLLYTSARPQQNVFR